MEVEIRSLSDMRKFNKAKEEVADKRAKKSRKPSKSATEKYVDKMIKKGIVDSEDREETIALYHENKSTKGSAWRCFSRWYNGDICDEELIIILNKMENAAYRHKCTDYDRINKRGMSEEEIRELRLRYSIDN